MKLILTLLSLVLITLTANAQIVAVEVVTKAGDAYEGLTFDQFDDPSMNSNGSVIVVGTSTNPANDFIFVHDSIEFKASDSTNSTFDFFENQCGIDDMDNILFMADENGVDGIYKSNLGLMIAEGDPAPGIGPAGIIQLLYRPQLMPDGTGYFVASVDSSGGTSSNTRVLYQIDPVGNLSVMASSQSNYSGKVLDALGLDFDFDVSEDGSHYIIVADLFTGSTLDDGAVIVDGNVVLQENSPIGVNVNYDQFDHVRINNNGDYIVTGDSDGAFATDEYLIVNGAIQIYEGDVIGGITLNSTATVNAIDLNNNQDVLFTWGAAGANEYLFHGNLDDPNGLVDSKLILRRFDTIDVNNDFVGDYIINDFNAFTAYRGFELKDTNILYLNVDLLDMNSSPVGEAIIRVDPFCRPLRTTISYSPCFNDTLMISGNQVTQSVTLYDTIVSGTCVSIDRHVVSYYPQPPTVTESAVICDGDSVFIAGSYYSQAGTYNPVFSSVVTGCDSAVIVQIALLPTYETHYDLELCIGDSIYAGGAYQMASGVYMDTLSSQYFCDSVIVNTLNFLPELTSTQSYNLCQGDSLFVGGAYQFTSGLYNDTVSAQFGCDSILVHDLTFNALPTTILDNFPTDSICADGAALSLPNGLPSGGTYSGNGVNGTNFDPALTGLLGESVVYYTYTDTNGCSSTDQTSIVVYDCYLGLNELSNTLTVFPNPSQGIFNVVMSTSIQSEYKVFNELGQLIKSGTIQGTELQLNLSDQQQGYYYLEIGVERFKLLLHR